MTLLVERSSNSIPWPVRSSEKAAGLDLFASETVTLCPFVPTLISTGIRIRLPSGCYGRIAPRSGLAYRHNLWVNAGVIDRDYTGEIFVVMMNMNTQSFNLQSGTKCCQLICENVTFPRIVPVTKIPTTERGENGFGSTD